MTVVVANSNNNNNNNTSFQGKHPSIHLLPLSPLTGSLGGGAEPFCGTLVLGGVIADHCLFFTYCPCEISSSCFADLSRLYGPFSNPALLINHDEEQRGMQDHPRPDGAADSSRYSALWLLQQLSRTHGLCNFKYAFWSGAIQNA